MRFMRKPPLVEAIKYTGFNWYDILNMCRGQAMSGQNSKAIEIYGDEETMTLNVGDWLVREPAGRYYVVNDREFHETYDPYEDGE